MTPILRFDRADLGYGRTPVLTGVTASLEAGQALALIGPNGSGKTTLLRSILGDAAVLGGSVEAEAGVIGYVPQSADLDLEFPVTAREVVTMGVYGELGWFRRPHRGHRRAVADALERVGMEDRAGQRFGRLSGGQRQRILLARALVARPRLVLLDEPFNGLDQPNRDALLDIITQMKADGVGVIASTHDLSLARRTCDLALLLAGRQIAFGPLDRVLDPDLLAAAYGGEPDAVIEATAGQRRLRVVGQ
ncbi:metal ABC transporter ATP-binding protein [Actinomyces sp. B33]|uniref:metal ABC transporter ATP-binding protein n=1 Tax=Actinomyces sp. B33 TaxID=2942131 RepID=UPI0023408CEF|nr:metal ABC transporter ATP-binding protein [Actinomyces sp. B33]MDC4233710.1 metal ABC transporter ATP-binding protein [Actinomyces sp. B33]